MKLLFMKVTIKKKKILDLKLTREGTIQLYKEDYYENK